MSLQLAYIYSFIDLFIHSFIYLFTHSFRLLFLTSQLLCSSFSAKLSPILKHYLVLLSSISFSIISSKYTFFY